MAFTLETWRPISGPPSPEGVRGTHLILVGLGFVPHRHSGDKNFWYELIPHLLEAGIGLVTIISLDSSHQLQDKQQEYFSVNGQTVCLRRLPTRILRWNSDDSNRGDTFPLGVALLEKMLSPLMLAREIKESCLAPESIQVHLMDNLGPANFLLASLLPMPLSVSAIALNGRRQSIIRTIFAQMSYRHPKITVVAYTRAYRDWLRKRGMKKVRHIPWGVDLSRSIPSQEEKKAAKTFLGLDASLPLYAWAGFIQQINEADFHLALDKAREALAQGLKATFFFAFKPESYTEDFASCHEPERGIVVKRTTVKEFQQLQVAADVFYSPLSHQSHIMGPPLTWIEFMARGVPIVTTAVGGVEEIVDNGRTGIVVSEVDSLPDKLMDMGSHYREMTDYCYIAVRQQRDIREIAQQYYKLWFGEHR